MRFEERLAIRLVIRALIPLLLVGELALQAAFYQDGPTPLFFGLLLGVPLFLFICARLIIRRRGARASGELDTAHLVGRRGQGGRLLGPAARDCFAPGAVVSANRLRR